MEGLRRGPTPRQGALHGFFLPSPRGRLSFSSAGRHLAPEHPFYTGGEVTEPRAPYTEQTWVPKTCSFMILPLAPADSGADCIFKRHLSLVLKSALLSQVGLLWFESKNYHLPTM